MSPFDAICLFDDQKNRANPVLCLVFDKFDYEEMKNYLLEKTKAISRGRSKIVKIFGLFYFKQMSDAEWE